MKMRDCPSECGTVDTYGTDWCVTQPFPAGESGGAISPPAGFGAEPRRQTHFCKNLLRINLKSGLFSVTVVMFRLMIVRMRPESGNSTYVTGRRPTRGLEVQ